MTKYFVTGATGFIGMRLIEALVARGDEVRALTRRSGLVPPSPPGFDWADGGPIRSPQVEWVQGDLSDRESLRRAMTGATRVFHLAGYAKNWAPSKDIFWEINVQGTRNILDAAAELGIERVVWTSTQLTLPPTPRGQVADENTPRIAAPFFNDYQETKVAAEHETVARAAQGFPVVIVMPTRVYGPGYLTEGNSVSLLVDQYDRGQVPFLLNWGRNVGNWVYVDDVVAGLQGAMEQGRPGQCYLLGGENASLGQFFRLIDQVSGKRHFQLPLLRFFPMLFAYAQKKRADWFGVFPQITPGWMRLFLTDWTVSTKKAEQEFGYRWTSLEEGLKRTYAWLLRVRATKK